MPSPFPSPYLPVAWRESHAIDDGAFAAAYDALDGRERSVLKKCIARLHRIWGERSGGECRTRRFNEGFGLMTDESPAAFAFIVCDSACSSPAAFLAALMPAILAGVRALFPCFVAGSGAPGAAVPAAPLLAALELAGIDQAYTAGEDELRSILDALQPQAVRGRLVLLGGPMFCESLAVSALRSGMACRHLAQPPLYYSSRLDAVAAQRFSFKESTSPENIRDAVMENADESAALLSLDAAHEDVWVWPDLSPAWFRIRRMKLYSLQG